MGGFTGRLGGLFVFGGSCEAATSGCGECGHGCDVGIVGVCLQCLLGGLFDGVFGSIQVAKGVANGADLLVGEAASFEADFVDATHDGGDAVSDGEGEDVFGEFGVSADECVLADACELDDAGVSADDGVVAYDDVAGEHGCAAHDDVVAEDAFVGDVAVGLNEAVAADAGAGTGGCGGVYGDVFADDGAVPDGGVGDVAWLVFEVLGLHAEASEGEDFAGVSDGEVATEYDVAVQLGVVAKANVWTDVAEGANDAVLAKVGA